MDNSIYAEILDLFTDKEDFREWTRRPFVNTSDNNNIWATECHIAAILPAGTIDVAMERKDLSIHHRPLLKTDEQLHISITQIKDVLAKFDVEEIMEKVKVPCPECKGSGTVTWTYRTSNFTIYDNDDTCPECGGRKVLVQSRPSGKFRPIPYEFLGIMDAIFNTKYFNLILKAMEMLQVQELIIENKPHPVYPTQFRIGDILRVVLMPSHPDEEDKAKVINLL